jgi:hypothetical protein
VDSGFIKAKIRKREVESMDETYIDCTFPQSKKEFAEFEKNVIKGLKSGLWDKEFLEWQIELCGFEVELKALKPKERKERLDEARRTGEFDCYVLAAVDDENQPFPVNQLKKRIEILKKILKKVEAQTSCSPALVTKSSV